MTDISFSNFMNRKEDPIDVPPPVGYNLDQMDIKGLTGGADLTPLSADDFGVASRDDVNKHIERLKELGHNPTKLGGEMSDEEFKKFHGINW